MKLAIGCDEAGLDLKNIIVQYLKQQTAVPVEVADYGVFTPDPVDYPDIAVQVAEAVACEEVERGILICGTGIGMCITANKVPGVRAALCHDVYSAERARKSNDAQVLTMGARVIGPEAAKKVVEAWLPAEFAGGGSTRKVAKMIEVDSRYRRQDVDVP
ncbi:MAG: ribose 5-phosphate isomerase B [Anaerolineae bacterium]|nr:ribose 5-phosphate isomerase B [Anaerolineae bacterium]